MREVRRLRQQREWNQAELAFHAGLAPSVISEIETGKRDPSAGTLRKLASALEVDVPELFERTAPLKVQAPLPFDEESAEQRRPFDFREARNHLEGYCEHWEQLLAESDVADPAIDEFLATGAGWIPTLDVALRSELNELRNTTGLRGSELLAKSELAQVNKRYLDLFSEFVKVAETSLSRRAEAASRSALEKNNVVDLQERLSEMQRRATG